MSDKQNVIIEADDITIIQGEKAKNYNVRLTRVNGSPIGTVPVTIAFYNKDYSFSKEVFTDKFGNASVPLYLTGDSWKVDVHFKGFMNFLPNLVTREVTIQEFQQKLTYIESENLHINEDDVISTDDGWYTVYLKDEDDMPVQFEPINFNIVSTNENIDDVDFVLKTDENGKIVVPYLTHNDTVVITVDYKGCTRYSSFSKADVVSFDDIADRTEVFFRTNESYLEIKKGNGNWANIRTAEDTVERVIVNYPNDNRTVHDGMLYYYAMNSNLYQVTLFYKGNSNYFSKCETLTYDKPNDSRVTLWQWIELQSGEQPYYTLIFSDNHDGGKLNHITLRCLFELPYELVYMRFKNGEFDGTYDFEVKGLPTYGISEGGNYPTTIVEYDIANPLDINRETGFSLSFYLKPNDYIKNATSPNDDILIAENSFSFYPIYDKKGTLDINGFGYQNNAYQNLKVNSTNDLAISYDKINEYALLRLLNTDTLEEFYFYSYLVDNVTPVDLNFVLGLGNWDLDVLSKEYEDYGGDFYQTSAIISDLNPIEYVTDFFYDETNYNTITGDDIVITDTTISTTSTSTNYIVSDSFTNSNTYSLSFALTGGLLIASDTDNEDTNVLKIGDGELTHYKEEQIIDTQTLENTDGNYLIERNKDTWNIYYDNTLIYTTTELFNNTIGLYGAESTITNLSLYVEPQADITPSTDDYDGSVYGSDLHLEVRNDKINLYDYGMLPSGAIGSAKVIASDIPLTTDQLALELEIKYNNNKFERLDNLTGEMQIRVYENALTSQESEDYAKTLCSPMPVQDVETVFTRHSDEGTLYYIKDPRMTPNAPNTPTYLCNAYTQYKGGVEIQTETGISLFNLDNAHSPVYVGNDLVRAEFHRRSGFIKISRYDENSDSWATVNVLKLQNKPNLSVNTYNDDYGEIQFGATTWKFYRGRPFIVVNHRNDDLRILNLVDRVYCEIYENQRNMGFIEEKDAVCGIFNPQTSIQQFRQELHIGQNIKLDNFELYDIANNNDIIDVSDDSTITLTKMDNDNAVQINKTTTDKVGLNFPSYSNYVKRVGADFSLLIEKIQTTGSATDTMNVTIKARGFDERGAIPLYNGYQYGIWEQTHTFDVDTTKIDKIRATFTNCPTEVKYIDFIVILEANDDITVTMKDFMYYDGKDIDIAYDTDISQITAERTEIYFGETYYANLYNDDDEYGLCIVRPSKEQISLRRIYASDETVLIPYTKKATYWDKPSQVFVEYLKAKRQVIDIEKGEVLWQDSTDI